MITCLIDFIQFHQLHKKDMFRSSTETIDWLDQPIEDILVYDWFVKLGGDLEWLQKRLTDNLRKEIDKRKHHVYYYARQPRRKVEFLSLLDIHDCLLKPYNHSSIFLELHYLIKEKEIRGRCGWVEKTISLPDVATSHIESLEEYQNIEEERRLLLKTQLIEEIKRLIKSGIETPETLVRTAEAVQVLGY